jgi:hypothetical protein
MIVFYICLAGVILFYVLGPGLYQYKHRNDDRYRR